MSQGISFWLSVSGAVTGFVGMITGIGAAAYARRQAIAAEGPKEPEIEISGHGWDTENEGWYSIHLTVRNRTNIGWLMSDAKIVSLLPGKLISQSSRPFSGPEYSPTFIPLNDLDRQSIGRETKLMVSIQASGTRDWAGTPGNSAYVHLYVKPNYRSRSASIRFTFSDKAAIARQRKITLKRRLEPKTITPV